MKTASEQAIEKRSELLRWGKLSIAIRQYRCLYDKSCKEYKDKNIKNNAWKKVAEDLDMESRKYEFVIFPCMFSNSNQISFRTIEITKETNIFFSRRLKMRSLEPYKSRDKSGQNHYDCSSMCFWRAFQKPGGNQEKLSILRLSQHKKYTFAQLSFRQWRL